MTFRFRKKKADPSPEKTVLLINDDSSVCDLVSDILASRPLRLLLATDGEPGLETLRQEKVHLLILNQRMHGMNGDEVLRVMAADPRLRKIPVLMCTGVSKDSIEGGIIRKIGETASIRMSWLKTPFDCDQLLEAVDALLKEVPRPPTPDAPRVLRSLLREMAVEVVETAALEPQDRP